jgi:hypothetical protein
MIHPAIVGNKLLRSTIAVDEVALIIRTTALRHNIQHFCVRELGTRPQTSDRLFVGV